MDTMTLIQELRACRKTFRGARCIPWDSDRARQFCAEYLALMERVPREIREVNEERQLLKENEKHAKLALESTDKGHLVYHCQFIYGGLGGWLADLEEEAGLHLGFG